MLDERMVGNCNVSQIQRPPMISFSLRLYTYPGKKTRADGATFPEATVIKTTHYRGAESPREPALRESSPQPVLVTPGLPLGRLRCSAGRECTETPLSDPDVSMESPQPGISPRKGRSGYRQRIPQGLRASVSIPYRACSRALQGKQTGLN